MFLDILKNLFALVVFFCLAAVLIIIGVHIFLMVVVVMAVAFVWYSIKFYFLRRKLQDAMREHGDTRFSDGLHDSGRNGPVIEGEFEEVDSTAPAEAEKRD